MDEYEKYRKQVRDEGFKINPWRLGVRVGEAGKDLPSPYSNNLSTRQYNEGLEWGFKLFEKAKSVKRMRKSDGS